MSEFLIDFQNIEWESEYSGQRQKTYTRENQRLRLVELTDEYPEEEWCEKEHIGYVLKGRIIIKFNGKSITFNEGDGIFIPGGKENRHKGRMIKGEKVHMLLFERILKTE
ncbi:cupin domain-containing protein [Thermoproteota archaeon]